MQVLISTRGLTISPIYRDGLTQKLDKLSRLVPKAIEAKAVLSREKHRRTAALTLLAKDHVFRSEETADDLGVALDMAIDALARQVREMKDRVKNRKGRGARRLPRPAGRAGEPPPADLMVSRLPLKPMSLEDAMEQFQRGVDDFMVFANASTDAVNVLYRRRDGALGLIETVS